ncbi:MAG: MopE-related protein [Myxococcota bacterium]|jgi:hypothetical protein|nr:MopE-related protein [Myxococcota bacterium]
MKATRARRARWQSLVSVLLLLGLWIAGCGRGVNELQPSEDSRLKEFGELCEYNEECRSTYCLTNDFGSFCTHRCDLGCPPGWECKNVLDPHGGEGYVALCAVVQNRLCAPCYDDLSCSLSGADRCLELDDGRFCGRDCSFSTCPSGYDCANLVTSTGPAQQCVPSAGICACTADTVGMVRGCELSNDFGTCVGVEECGPNQTWGVCSAGAASEELCNGADDDCDGFIDEDLVPLECSVSNQFGTCVADEQCLGFAGWQCPAPEPMLESCNGLDDDCNGMVDDGFADEQGLYVARAHCGACNNDCDRLLEHSTRTTCELIDGVPTCRALACEEGYFVYGDGQACMALPSNLCKPCAVNEDCLAPESECITRGFESFCGRSCAPGSVFGTSCPEGYTCEVEGQGMQCVPESGSCLCTEVNEGTSRSCEYDTCVGYQSCERFGIDFRWTDCNVMDYNVEICDSLDNNCDGRIDEGYLNPTTGRYDSDEHCGFCFNECALYWIPEVDHVNGICDASGPGTPRCVMGPCLTETIAGVSYEWVDVNGDSSDGCECRRRQGNTTVDSPELIATYAPGYEYVDENCDGVDGVVARALFVRAGAAAGDGTRAKPYGTLMAAVDALPSSGKDYILVAEGRYDETLTVRVGTVLHGGYAADFASRDVVLHASVIRGVGEEPTVIAQNVSTGQAMVSGFVIQGRDMPMAADNVPGLPSVAVWVKDSNESLSLRSNHIRAGEGGPGGRGSSGEAGYGRQSSAALDGGEGRDGARSPGPCPSSTRFDGGPGGANSACPASSATRGGHSYCPVFDLNTNQGARAEYTSSADKRGLGGYDWTFDFLSGVGCGHATESGYPSNPQSNVGLDGGDGLDGGNGSGGAGAVGFVGSLRDGRWVASPLGAVDGISGTHGAAGGGGGAGGGTAYYYTSFNDCAEYEQGPSGGGGGAGGCGGAGGKAGRQGGASIALLLVDSSGAGRRPQLLGNLFERGQGGAGGAGGFGGMGGLGGVGGFGGGPPSWIASKGGKGGDGGNGGPGGGGGGGAGGPSYDIMALGIEVTSYLGQNSVVYGNEVPTGGGGGAGGGSVGSGASGTAGVAGAYGNTLSLQACGTGGSCPSGQSCDANQVCVPAP